MLPTVSIICVNYNGLEQVKQFLASVKTLNYPKKNLETVVVDNGSHDGSIQLISKQFPRVKLIPLKNNHGYGPALNIGIRLAKSSYIFIANNDLKLHPDSLKTLVEYSIKHPDIGILGGKLISKINGAPSSGFSTFNYWTGIVKMAKKEVRKITEVQWVQGCAMVVAKKTLDKIGLFDERFSKIYFEDLDLCRRTQKAGLKTVIIPKAIFYHYQSFTMDKIMPKSIKLYYWNKSKIGFIFKYGNFWQIMSILSIQLLVSIYHSIMDRPYYIKVFLKALRWNLKNQH